MTKTSNQFISRSAFITNLSVSLSGGVLMNGWQGGVAAFSSTIADEFLINHNITSKHYLTTTALWTSIIILAAELILETFPQYTLPIYGLGLIFGVGIAYFGNDPLNYRNNIEDVTSHLMPAVKLFDDENIISHEELIRVGNVLSNDPYEGAKIIARDIYYLGNNKLLISISATNILTLFEVLMNHSFIKYIGNSGTTMLILTLINQKQQDDSLYQLTAQGAKISLLLCGQNIVQSILNFGKNYLTDNLAHAIKQKTVEKILLNPEHVKKILKAENTSEIIYKSVQDINNLLTMGSYKLTAITTEKIKELIAFRDLLELAPASILISYLSGLIKKQITSKAQAQFNDLSKLSTATDLENAKIVADLSKNFSGAILTDATDFIRQQYSKNIANKMEIMTGIKLSQQLKGAATNILETWQKFIEIIYYSYKITSGTLAIEQVPVISTWINNVSPLLQGGIDIGWPEGNIALARVKQISALLSSPLATDITYEYNQEDKIIITDYKLLLRNETILTIERLELLGNRCAISGASGVGKSSILKDMQNCLSYPLKSTGNFSFPTNAKSMFIDQNLFIPATATLFQAITMQLAEDRVKLEREGLKSKIIQLFKQLKIDVFASEGREDGGIIAALDDPLFNSDNLSGGQKKKIGIVKAIITEPQILFADEIFVGLDPISLFIAQSLLKQYLPPRTKTIVVDHYAANNNYEGFYDYCIELSHAGWQAVELQAVTPPEYNL
jgi:ABC-type lipoprotein export system ATPase subunit